MGEMLVNKNLDIMWCISYLIIEEIQISRKPPVKASDEQIYLDKENNWKVMCFLS